MSFARNVKTLREKNNLTVRQLADVKKYNQRMGK